MHNFSFRVHSPGRGLPGSHSLDTKFGGTEISKITSIQNLAVGIFYRGHKNSPDGRKVGHSNNFPLFPLDNETSVGWYADWKLGMAGTEQLRQCKENKVPSRSQRWGGPGETTDRYRIIAIQALGPERWVCLCSGQFPSCILLRLPPASLVWWLTKTWIKNLTS